MRQSFKLVCALLLCDRCQVLNRNDLLIRIEEKGLARDYGEVCTYLVPGGGVLEKLELSTHVIYRFTSLQINTYTGSAKFRQSIINLYGERESGDVFTFYGSCDYQRDRMR